jgi:hypothetical protein
MGANLGLNTAPNSGSAVRIFYAGLIVALIMLVVIYYKTIWHYIRSAWESLTESRPTGAEIPPPRTSECAAIAAIDATLHGIEKDVATALTNDNQVFNVSRNLYTFADAEPLCRAFGAELATYDQVKDAYEAGADWCNYGWVKGQLAVYPTQKGTYEKLQQGPEEKRMSCGLPGVNGGYFPNADQRFGVNCYGKRPAETALDERTQTEVRADNEFDQQVNKFRSEIGSIAVNPWSHSEWSS